MKSKEPIVLKSSAVTKALSTSRPLFKKTTLRQMKEKVFMSEEDDESHDEERSSNGEKRDENDGINVEANSPEPLSQTNSNKGNS